MQEPADRWLREWFAENAEGVPVSDADYHETGALDSLGVVSLVMDIEAHFGFRFGHRDFQDERFRTLAGLAEMIEERAGG